MGGRVDTTVSENQRLRKELKDLHARIAALESSRWWRLHPRFALMRLKPRRPVIERTAPTNVAAEEPPAANGVTARFRGEVVAHGHFSEDWFTIHIPAWERVMQALDGRPSKVLELGSFEGLSSSFLLWRLPDAQLTCVDTFAGIPEYAAYGIAGSGLEQSFDHNVALVDATRVRKLVGETHSVLPDLLAAGEEFDLVYVDASHRAVDVMVDAALSWKLLAAGGFAIFDDYGEIPAGENALDHPAPAIDAFLGVVAGCYEVVDRRRQLIIRKTA